MHIQFLSPEDEFFLMASFVLLAIGLLAGIAFGIALPVGRVPVGRRVLRGVAAAYLLSVVGVGSWFWVRVGSAESIPFAVLLGAGAIFIGVLVGASAGVLVRVIAALVRGPTRARAPSDSSPGGSVPRGRH